MPTSPSDDARGKIPASRLLRAVVDVTPDVYFVKDWDHRFLLVSHSLAEALGKTTEQLEGHLDTEFWPLETCEGDPATGRRGYHDEDRDALKGVSTRSVERVVLGDGIEHVFQTDRVPLRDENGDVLAVLGYARDVTASIMLEKRTEELETAAEALRDANASLREEVEARREAEERLRAANAALEERVNERTRALTEKIAQYERTEAERGELQEQLRQAQKLESIGRLAGGIAHDFNNILVMILGGVELARMQISGNEPADAELRLVEEAVHRAGDVTKQLLAFARRRHGPPEVIDLNEAVSSHLSLIRRLAREPIELELRTAELPAWVMLGASQLDQILTNLVINACDAIGERGKIRIAISVDTTSDLLASGRGVVTLEVKDDGHGMSKQTRDAIFDPFFTTKAVGQGSGLGLSMVYGIVKQHGGEIRVESEVGEGATFRIVLPAAAAVAAEPAEREVESVARGCRRILVVEDEELVLRVVGKLLTGSGFEVLAASGPDEALRLMRDVGAKVDLVITDVAMPGMTGRELARRLIELCGPVRVLYMSGHPSSVLTGESLLEDGAHFIQKPFSSEQLVAEVNDLFG